MIKLIKKTTVMLTLGCGLIFSQNTVALEADDAGETNAPATLSTNYISKKAEVNDLIAQDPAKNFAYQVKRHAKEELQSCQCIGHHHYLHAAKELWSKIRNADTNTEATRAHFQKFANSRVSVGYLPTGFSGWLQEHGYNVEQPHTNSGLPSFGLGLPMSPLGSLFGGAPGLSMDQLIELIVIKSILQTILENNSDDEEAPDQPSTSRQENEDFGLSNLFNEDNS